MSNASSPVDYLRGATDDTQIGNVSDALKVNVTGLTSSVEVNYTSLGKNWIATTNDVTIITTTETPILLIKNPNASGKIFKLDHLFMTGLGGTNITVFNIYIGPTITANGTSITAQGLRQTGMATLSSTLFKSPTIAANGTLLFHGKTQGAGDLELDFNYSLWLEANNNLLITTIIGIGTNPVSISLVFAEE